MDCHQVKAQLSAWTDGQLELVESKQIQAHLGSCGGCQEILSALQGVGQQLAALKAMPTGAVPGALLAGIRGVPDWLVRVAVLRQWLVPAGQVAAVGLIGFFLLQISSPLPAIFSSQGASQQRILVPGTTLMARTGQTVELNLALERVDSENLLTAETDLLSRDATVQLQGPGALVVRKAEKGRLRGDLRLDLDLPSGMVTIRFGPEAPPHDLRLMTPQAMIRLTGTWALIQATPAETRIGMVEGTAQVTNRATGKKTLVQAGQLAEIKAGWMRVRQGAVEDWLPQPEVSTGSGKAGKEAVQLPRENVPQGDSPEAGPLWYEND